MSRLRQSRATLTRDKGSRVKVASVTGRVARRTVARLVFGIQRCSILLKSRVEDMRQNCRCDIGLRNARIG